MSLSVIVVVNILILFYSIIACRRHTKIERFFVQCNIISYSAMLGLQKEQTISSCNRLPKCDVTKNLFLDYYNFDLKF